MTDRRLTEALLDLPDADRRTAELVASEYGRLRLDREVPTAFPAAGYRRGLLWAGGGVAAAAAAVLAAGTLTIATPAAAWAATPSVPNASDKAAAATTCADALTGVTDSRGAPPTGPEKLPPLQLLDIRGTGAYAVFVDDEWTVQCFLRSEDGAWTRGQVTAEPTGTSPGVAAFAVDWAGSTQWADDDTTFHVGGTVAPQTQRVTLELADGTVVEATVIEGRFAIWYPGDVQVSPDARLVAYDNGAKGEIGSLALPGVLSGSDVDKR